MRGVGHRIDIAANPAESWKSEVLITFDLVHGESPRGDLLLDAAGNLYRDSTERTQRGQPGGGGPCSLFDANGSLTETTHDGRRHIAGIEFQLAPPAAKGSMENDVALLHRIYAPAAT